MSFLNPNALWAFLGLIPLIALYFLKVRPDKKSTTTLFLWNRIYKEKKQNGLFKNLRDLISLIILILAFSAIALAMGKPVFTPKDSKRDLVLLLDNSASMSTIEQSKQRLQEAKTIVKNIIKSLTSSQNVIIATISDTLTIVTNATNNQRALLKGVEEIQQTELPLKSNELFSIFKNKNIMPDSRFILISDGCFQGNDKLDKLELIKIGKDVDNIGISSFDLRQIPSSNNSIGLFFQLVSTFKGQQEVDIMLAQGTPENIVKIIPVTVTPGKNKPQILTFSDQRTGKWFLTIDRQDAMALDNQAFAQLNAPSPLRINLDVPDDQPFFRQCIESFRASGQLMKVDDQNPEIAISFKAKNTNTLSKVIFNPQGESAFWQGDMSVLEQPTPTVLLPEHPAIRFSSLDTLPFDGAKNITAPKNSIILVETESKVPLLYKTTVDDVSAFVVNMDPMKSQLYFNIYFPIIIYSLSYDLAGREAEKKYNFSTGTFLKVSPSQKINGPNGTIPSINNSVKVDKAGFYEKTVGEQKESYAVSLTNKFESLVSNQQLQSNAKPIEANFPATDLLLILALILVSGECMLYHRRKVG
jgi:hypothetical protein